MSDAKQNVKAYDYVICGCAQPFEENLKLELMKQWWHRWMCNCRSTG